MNIGNLNKRLAATGLALTLTMAAASAWSQAYPSKPIKLVVGFAAGGSTDIAARQIAKRAGEILGQPMVVDNRPGAASNIAAQEVARAPSDGYTLLYMTSTLPVNETLYPKLPFDLVKDFTGVSPTVDIPCVLSVHPSLGVKTVKELIALAKSQPGKISYGSAGSGSGTHLATELFKTIAGIDIFHVPYKGAGPATTDFLGGHVKVLFVCQVSIVKDNVKTGRLVPLAVSSLKRLPNLADIPTMIEAGVPEFEATVWNGILAPSGTPREVVTKVNAAVAQAVKEQTAPLIETGAYPMYSSADLFTAFVKSEIVRWSSVVKMSGAKPE